MDDIGSNACLQKSTKSTLENANWKYISWAPETIELSEHSFLEIQDISKVEIHNRIRATKIEMAASAFFIKQL